MRMMKRMISCIAIAMAALGMGCTEPLGITNTDKNDTAGKSTYQYAEIFPFAGSMNRWYYSDADGNTFVIAIVDTISDDRELFYKVSFTEEKLASTQSDWFVFRNGEIRYSTSLRAAAYPLFVPSRFSGESGTFSSDSQHVSFVNKDSLIIGAHRFGSGVELSYARPLVHGFDIIRFADTVGIVSLTDNTGRWPIEYVLDSARIAGKVERF